MFAMFRSHPNADLAAIGEEHMQKDLSASDRELLRSAASRVSIHAKIGSLLGLGLGLVMARRIHLNRVAFYNAFKVVSRPTEIIFAGGRRGEFCSHTNSYDLSWAGLGRVAFVCSGGWNMMLT